jgi:Zn finger protein HypA/HybF involved in hydrogenase expression
MHELSLVEELVSACREQAHGRSVCQVRVRCPASVDAGEVSECFALVATGCDICLAGAELELEPVPVHLNCSCGYNDQLGTDHLAGHLAICPQCGHVGDIDAGLELVSMTFSKAVEPFGSS